MTDLIIPHSSWAIKDATKLNSYMECPRAYFYEYILGWRSEEPNIHLEFGKAWHYAMEYLLLHGYDNLSIINAYGLFLHHYRKFFSDVMDITNAPKDPGNAMKALVQYTQEYKNDKDVPIYTEIAGTVPLTEKHLLHFRMDSILRREDGMVQSREHKTGSTLGRVWEDQWSLAMQTGVYNHVLYCLYPREEVWGVEINGVFFQKKENKFKRIPSRRTTKMMNVWFWNTINLMDDLQRDHERLEECRVEDNVMKAFPQNTTNCTKYFGCRYHDFCRSWENPLQHVYDVPFGFKIEYWNPADEESTAKKVFRLDQLI